MTHNLCKISTDTNWLLSQHLDDSLNVTIMDGLLSEASYEVYGNKRLISIIIAVFKWLKFDNLYEAMHKMNNPS
ncbi:hypothetical protein C1646_778210 [Rhizophagus diaphanus]|nr:hypothetical protein C1646_778210 [Rhizophagus diaphanus] [Rhizophagus sp. MUCL 43196]